MLTYINTILLAWLVWQNAWPNIKARIYSYFGPGSWQLRIFGLYITYFKTKIIQDAPGQFSFSVKRMNMRSPLTIWLGSNIRLFPNPELVRR